mgnify:CR=1 FL=1
MGTGTMIIWAILSSGVLAQNFFSSHTALIDLNGKENEMIRILKNELGNRF